jgi:hypothetical protein
MCNYLTRTTTTQNRYLRRPKHVSVTHLGLFDRTYFGLKYVTCMQETAINRAIKDEPRKMIYGA